MTRPHIPLGAIFSAPGDTRSPRVDILILIVACVAAALFVAADILQRWILPDEMNTLNIDGRGNPVTWFHSAVLFGAAACCAAIALTTTDRRLRLAWLGLAPVVAFLSMDKAISLHERIGSKIENYFDLPEDAGRIAWQIAWSPIIVLGAILLVVCVAHANRRTQLWVLALAAAGAAKLLMEALMFPALRYWHLTQDSATFYGIEVNIEETIQLLGFACLFAGFAQLFVDRFWAMARGELDALERAHAAERVSIPAVRRTLAPAPTAAAPRRQEDTPARGGSPEPEKYR